MLGAHVDRDSHFEDLSPNLVAGFLEVPRTHQRGCQICLADALSGTTREFRHKVDVTRDLIIGEIAFTPFDQFQRLKPVLGSELDE